MRLHRIALAALLGLALLTTQGCYYFQNRAEDAMDIIDFGFTFSKEPYLNLFVDAPFVTTQPIGGGYLDGYFLGLGQGKLSLFAPCHFENWGFILYGEETVSYDGHSDNLASLDKAGEDRALQFSREFFYTGLVGIGKGLAEGRYWQEPGRTMKYIGTCPHNFHLGWFGIVATPRYWDMLDLIVGFTTLDLSQDDDAEYQDKHEGGWRAVRY